MASNFINGNSVEPLIEAAETYPALERAIRNARNSIHMAYWTIDPSLTVASSGMNGEWGDLIVDAIERGVTVRLVIADFDPILGRHYHASAWSSYRRFMALSECVDPGARARLQIICSRHEARVGTAIRILGQPIIQAQLTDAVAELNDVSDCSGREAAWKRFSIMPGLWSHIDVSGDRFSIAYPTLPTVYPAAHHEKLCVIDDRVVFLGGLDINARRFDTIVHDDDLAWHDVACKLEGPATKFFATHFRERWNSESADFLEFLANVEPPEQIEALPVPRNVPKIKTSVDDAGLECGAASVAPLRTISSQAKSTLSRSPKPDVSEILNAYCSAIATAQKLIYIETQFLRSETIVDALLQRAQHNEQLELIVLLPIVPEEALVDGEPDIATKQGQYLQNKWLSLLREKIGSRFGAFTLLRDGPAAPDLVNRPKRTERDIVYVHAKVMVIDEDLAIIGSANLNDRSMLTDTETAIAWRERDAVKHFRNRLWRHALGMEVSDREGLYVEMWSAQATRNADLPASKRQGFVMPMPEAIAGVYAEQSLTIPSELI